MLGRMMKELKIAVVELHGLLSQRERIANLQSFRSEEAKILIATDIAGRSAFLLFLFHFSFLLILTDLHP